MFVPSAKTPSLTWKHATTPSANDNLITHAAIITALRTLHSQSQHPQYLCELKGIVCPIPWLRTWTSSDVRHKPADGTTGHTTLEIVENASGAIENGSSIFRVMSRIEARRDSGRTQRRMRPLELLGGVYARNVLCRIPFLRYVDIMRRCQTRMLLPRDLSWRALDRGVIWRSRQRYSNNFKLGMSKFRCTSSQVSLYVADDRLKHGCQRHRQFN